LKVKVDVKQHSERDLVSSCFFKAENTGFSLVSGSKIGVEVDE
jgi:hypothetical protein